MSNVSIHIEDLVIHGMSSVDQEQLGRAVAQALTQMIAEQGLPERWQQSFQIPAIDGGRLQRPGSTESLGRQIAQAMYGSGSVG